MSRNHRKGIVLALVLALAGFGAVYAQTAGEPVLDAAGQRAIVDEIAGLLNKNYIFAETAKKIEERLRSRLAAGDYNAFARAEEFARAVSADLLDVGHDKHMGFAYAPERAADLARLLSRSPDEVKAARARQLDRARRDNFGFRKVERLDGNVGYIDFRYFADAAEAGETAVAAMNFLSHCDAVIVDLRRNGGGSPSQIQLLCSYFFDEPTHLNDLYYRAADTTANYWTLPYVPGGRMAGADLYILTSAYTFSGAEEFSYNMKNQKRAVIIGETTGGGAHPTDAMIVRKDFVLRVPVARAINPVSKTNWEGTGVTPDIPVPADEAFDRAYALAVEKLAAKASEPEVKAGLGWILAGLKAKTNSSRPDAKTLKGYAGVYGERKVVFENGALFYQRTGPKYRMIPMTATLFALEGLDNFRLEFIVKDGRAVEAVGLYDDGRREPSLRTK